MLTARFFFLFLASLATLPQEPAFAQVPARLAAGRASPAQLTAAVRRLGESFVGQSPHVGLSIGIVKDGQTHFYQFGTTEKGKSQAPTQNTVYEIGSISKTFTSLLLAQAVVEKRVRLDDDIRRYLPGAYPNLAFAGQPIRLEQLANTTSGLPDNLPVRPHPLQEANPDSVQAMAVRLLDGYTKQKLYNDLRSVQLDTVPGRLPRHSNVAAQLLAYILEDVYKRPYAELIKHYIEQPLGMASGTISAVAPTQQTTGYNAKGTRMPYFTMQAMQAAGGLKYSSADMAKYLKYQLAEPNAAVRLSHRAAWGNPDQQAIALNWNLDKTVDSKLRLQESGGTFGFASYCELYPELHYGVVLLSNESDPTTQGQLGEIAEQLLTTIYGVPPALAAFQNSLETHHFKQAQQEFAAAKRQHPELHLTEDYVNTWGYRLARKGQPQQALELFKLNVSLYPHAWNTYDSLAETYETLGDRLRAIENYQHSLALNAQNTNAAEHLKKLNEAASK